jgi:hypothetical protein
MFEELQLTVGSLGENWCAEGLHDFLYGNGLAGKLIFGRAVVVYCRQSESSLSVS